MEDSTKSPFKTKKHSERFRFSNRGLGSAPPGFLCLMPYCDILTRFRCCHAAPRLPCSSYVATVGHQESHRTLCSCRYTYSLQLCNRAVFFFLFPSPPLPSPLAIITPFQENLSTFGVRRYETSFKNSSCKTGHLAYSEFQTVRVVLKVSSISDQLCSLFTLSRRVKMHVLIRRQEQNGNHVLKSYCVRANRKIQQRR